MLVLYYFINYWISLCTAACPTLCLCLSPIQRKALKDLTECVSWKRGNSGKQFALSAKMVLRKKRDFPPDTQEITITQQDIEVIPPNAFGNLKHLRKLILDSNNISKIEPFAFKGLRDVEEISLQNNLRLTRLPGFSFAGLRNVTNLILGHNRIVKIDGYAFAGTEMIQTLLLNNNPIKVVNSSAFSGLKQIEFLYLPAGVRNLQTDAFNGLESVGFLKLAYLDLIELASNTFRGLENVRVLSIENSDLATIKENGLHGMSDIGELRILNNKIDRIKDLSIPAQSFVTSLFLSGNHILEIPLPEALQNIHVKKVKVVKNHFPCTCEVLNLLGSVVGNSSGFLSSNRCISPFSLNGGPMSNMVDLGLLRKCEDRRVSIETSTTNEKTGSVPATEERNPVKETVKSESQCYLALKSLILFAVIFVEI